MFRSILFCSIFLFLDHPVKSQVVSLIYPDSQKGSSVYYSPYTLNEASSFVQAVLPVSERYFKEGIDTLFLRYLNEFERLQGTGVDSLVRKRSNPGLKIVVDTEQEITVTRRFSASFLWNTEFAGYYLSPRYVSLIDHGRSKKLSLKRDSTFRFSAYPVYILNASDTDKKVLNRGNMPLVQEVIAPNGEWVEIEYQPVSVCSMDFGWYTLPAKCMLVTSTLKYGGDYQTQARLRFYDGSYSYGQPFPVRVNSELFSGKHPIKYFDFVPCEKW